MASGTIRAGAGRQSPSWLPRWFTGESALGWVSPVVVMLLIFGVYPLLYSLWLTFHA